LDPTLDPRLREPAVPSVVALVLFEWAAGLVAGASWTQSWSVIRRGHFRIVAWIGLILAAAALFTLGPVSGLLRPIGLAFLVACALYVGAQRLSRDSLGAVIGYGAGAIGAVVLGAGVSLLAGWPRALAGAQVLAGALLLGAVTNGMLLGHWYLNQPGLKPWALARLTNLSLIATVLSGATGLLAVGRLAGATTAGAAFSLPGFGDSFAGAFFAVWVGLIAFTGVIVYMARRCVQIRSIQSATGLYYVAILTAGVAEFLIRYLMLGST
jgi:hypothetical protein